MKTNFSNIILTISPFQYTNRNPRTRFLKAHLDKTWFNLTLRTSTVTKVCELIGLATGSKEFAEECLKEIEEGTIPYGFLDFWYRGCTTSEESFNNQFLLNMTKTLRTHLDENNPVHMTVETEQTEEWAEKGTLKDSKLQDWDMRTDERENNEKFDIYFPAINNVATDLSFHSLFTSMAFDHNDFQTEHWFTLHPSCQVPCNNRDVEVKYITEKEKPHGSMMDYISHQKDSKNDRAGRFSTSPGYFILMERKRREDVDPEIADRLAPHTTMMEIQTTDANPVTRYEGIKTLGDHVSLPCSYQAMEDLFKVLTVSDYVEKGTT